MRDVTAWFVLLGLPVILLVDWLVYWYEGYKATITCIVREWQDQTILTEVIFVLGVLLLWAHIFRRWY